jgi:hypothetical protein
MSEIPITRGRGGVSVAPRSLAAQLPKPKIPSEDQRAGSYKTKTATFLTTPGAISILCSADTPWVKVTMLLETGGPVSVSTAEDFSVTSGTGIALQTDIERVITLPKGNRLYITSPTVNRVSYIVEPVPWLEQILGAIVNGLTIVAKQIMALGGKS